MLLQVGFKLSQNVFCATIYLSIVSRGREIILPAWVERYKTNKIGQTFFMSAEINFMYLE